MRKVRSRLATPHRLQPGLLSNFVLLGAPFDGEGNGRARELIHLE